MRCYQSSRGKPTLIRERIFAARPRLDVFFSACDREWRWHDDLPKTYWHWRIHTCGQIGVLSSLYDPRNAHFHPFYPQPTYFSPLPFFFPLFDRGITRQKDRSRLREWKKRRRVANWCSLDDLSLIRSQIFKDLGRVIRGDPLKIPWTNRTSLERIDDRNNFLRCLTILGVGRNIAKQCALDGRRSDVEFRVKSRLVGRSSILLDPVAVVVTFGCSDSSAATRKPTLHETKLFSNLSVLISDIAWWLERCSMLRHGQSSWTAAG